MYNINIKEIINTVKNELAEEFVAFIERHDDNAFSWKHLALNKNMTIDVLEKHLDKPWAMYMHYVNISKRNRLTMDILNNYTLYQPIWKWDWYYISKVMRITLRIIDENIDRPWHWKGLSANPYLTMDIVNKYSDKPWNWASISINENITMQDVLNYPDKPWNWLDISRNPNITMAVVERHLDKPWDFYGISMNPNVTIDFINKHPCEQWSWYHISHNVRLSASMLKKYINKPWDWNSMMTNPFITLEIIEIIKGFCEKSHIQSLAFKYSHIVMTLNDLYKIPTEELEWHYVSLNKHLSFDFIDKYPDKEWDWYQLSNNSYDYENRYNNKIKKQLMAFRIQCYWRKCYYDPKYLICRNRLERDYEKLYG